MITIVLVTILLIFACVLLLGIKVFFTKNGTFPTTHVGRNKNLKDKGISCAQSQDMQSRNHKTLFERLNESL